MIYDPFGYVGGLQDRETGYVNFGAREYDPKTGRWTSKEPLGFDGSMNFYGYCEGDPVNFVDVSGLDANLKNLNKIRKLYQIKDLTYKEPLLLKLFGDFKYNLAFLNANGGYGIIHTDFMILLLTVGHFMKTGKWDPISEFITYRIAKLSFDVTTFVFKSCGVDKTLEDLGEFIYYLPDLYQNFSDKYFYHPFWKIGEYFSDRRYNFRKKIRNIKSYYNKNKTFFNKFNWAF